VILASSARIAEYTARGWWGTRRIHDVFADAVQGAPDAVALVDAPDRDRLLGGPPRRLAWRDVDREVTRFAALLIAAGAARDDIVVVQLPNCVEQACLYIACIKLGLIASPVPVQYREHELRTILARTRARLFVTATRILRHAHARMALGLARGCDWPIDVIALGADVPEGAIDPATFDPAPDAAAGIEAFIAQAPVTANDIATVCWTSGTEGDPKGVPRSHNEWLAIPENIIVSGGLQRGCHLLNPFPMVNMAGLSGAFLPWLLLAGKLVQHHPFDLATFLAQVRDEAIDYTVCAPATLVMLAQHPELTAGIDFRRLSRIGSGGGPLSAWACDTLAARHGVAVINYFGSNEGASLTGSTLDVPDPALRARFFPRFGAGNFRWQLPISERVRSRLVDPASGEEITIAGVPGELRMAGPAIFAGYWQAPEATARAFDAEGFYRTGDLFEIAGDRGEYYRFVGRVKDIVVRGGFNISAAEIEGLLVGHPAIVEAAVIGYPDETLGERVCAVVVVREGATIDLPMLVGYLRDDCRVAAYKLPERLELIDALPRNPVGKVVKRRLLERFGSP